MFNKIRYRLVYNYSGKLNKEGKAPVALECRQGKKKMYISSGVLLSSNQWRKGQVINHVNANKLTIYLIKWRNSIEEIELNALLKGHSLSLSQLKLSVKNGLHENASLRDFTLGFVENSDRKNSTKKGYEYMINDIEKDYGKLMLEDITYDWILKWKQRMRDSGLSENTIKGRLKLLKCIINEGIKRNLIDEEPFKYITIGNMTPKAVWLTLKEIQKIEKLKLRGKEDIIRDLFLLGCYTGLRWSDLSTLEEAEIKDGVMKKVMKKTGHSVSIPINTLFWGKGREIINKYPNIKKLSHCCCNSTANRKSKGDCRKGWNKKASILSLGKKVMLFQSSTTRHVHK